MQLFCVHLSHPLVIWSSGRPERLGVGLIQIQAVEGTILNPVKGTPGAELKKEPCLCLGFSQDHTDRTQGKTEGGISSEMWDMG